MKTFHDGLEDYATIQRALARSIERRAEERGDDILAKMGAGTSLGLDQDLRHLAGQVRRQRDLPRDTIRDGRFLLHLEHALRDLAVQP